jgi:hypothetical protein
VRQQQLDILFSELSPTSKTTVLDVGTTTDVILPDSNFFEQRYPYPKKILAVSVEDCTSLFKNKFPNIEFRQIEANKKLPFKNNEFDIVTSWATIEHVGDRKKQAFFLSELFRVGKNVFVTTPNKLCPYEPHSALWFVHWLPHSWFSNICKLLGKDFWADINNLLPLSFSDIKSMIPKGETAIIQSFKMFKLLPSHLIIIKSEK